MQIRSKTAALLYSLNSNRANSRQQTVSQSMTFSLPILHIENIIILNNEHRHKQTHSHTYTEHRDAKTHTYVHTFKQTTQKKLQTYTTHKNTCRNAPVQTHDIHSLSKPCAVNTRSPTMCASSNSKHNHTV